MRIVVISQSPELFWYVSGALPEGDRSLKHLETLKAGEKEITDTLPEIVVLNGDEDSDTVTEFIGRIRNHVFARNTLFVVTSSDASIEYRRALLISGAAFVLYLTRTQKPHPRFFAGLIQWLSNVKGPDQKIFEHKPVPIRMQADWMSYGRVGWISPTHCLIETNVDLESGQSIQVENKLFEDLEIKDVRLQCQEKNKVGRFYQYANSLLCTIQSKDPERDQKKIRNWIKDNHSMTKPKAIKVVYFESDAEYREEIRSIIKLTSSYCARGYGNHDSLQDILAFQLPQLVIINRALINKDRAKFAPITKFLKSNHAFCVTYSPKGEAANDEFKKAFPFALHVPAKISAQLFESMIEKLSQKQPPLSPEEEKERVYLGKRSVHSRLTVRASCDLIELGETGIGVSLPFRMSNYCACEISSPLFGHARLEHTQFFRTFFSRKAGENSSSSYHRCLFIGHEPDEKERLKALVEEIAKQTFEVWNAGASAQANVQKGKTEAT